MKTSKLLFIGLCLRLARGFAVPQPNSTTTEEPTGTTNNVEKRATETFLVKDGKGNVDYLDYDPEIKAPTERFCARRGLLAFAFWSDVCRGETSLFLADGCKQEPPTIDSCCGHWWDSTHGDVVAQGRALIHGGKIIPVRNEDTNWTWADIITGPPITRGMGLDKQHRVIWEDWARYNLEVQACLDWDPSRYDLVYESSWQHLTKWSLMDVNKRGEVHTPNGTLLGWMP